jgi:purine-binding chemotaxis protein CheW
MPDASVSRTGAAFVRSFLTFRLGAALYALPTESITEVVHVPPAARVPQSPPALLGIANLRGTVLPLVSLRELLGLGELSSPTEATRAIVIDVGAPVALVVESVDSLVAVDESSIEMREAELGAHGGELLSGAFPSGTRGEVAKVLDLKALLSTAFAARARAARRSGGAANAAKDTRESEAGAAASTMLVTFDVAGQEFALNLEAVQEILPAPDVLVSVPRAEALVLGVTSLRDRLLPLLSLRGLLGFPPAPTSDGREKVVVMKIGGAQVGLVADRARTVLAVRPSSIDPVPAVLSARAGGETRIKAIYRGDEGRRLISILMPEQLFKEDVMRRLNHGDETGSARAARADVAPQAELKFLVFRLGSDEFGLPIDAVDEVGEVPEKVTRLPKTPKFLEGVVNLRGDVLPVVDQRRRFDMPPLAEADRRRLVVVRSDGQRAGLIVDGVSDVLRVPAGAVEPAPDLTEQIARLVRGVINLATSERIVLVLDPSELLTPAERGKLDAFRKSQQANA